MPAKSEILPAIAESAGQKNGFGRSKNRFGRSKNGFGRSKNEILRAIGRSGTQKTVL
jgi:hypothetical protein